MSKHILFVEDDETQRDMFASAVSDWNDAHKGDERFFTFDVAETVESAQAALDRLRCDAALFDALRGLHIEKGDKLTLEDIERGNVLPGNTIFYGRPLSTTTIERKGRPFVSMGENIDTVSPTGRLLLGVVRASQVRAGAHQRTNTRTAGPCAPSGLEADKKRIRHGTFLAAGGYEISSR